MDNFKLPAYPEQVMIHPHTQEVFTANQMNSWTGGFTKLEKAALMIAAGMANRPEYYKIEEIASFSVTIAEAVLLQANK